MRIRRTSRVVGTTTTAYTYNAASQLTAATGTTYTYDLAGRRLSEAAGSTPITYTYDAPGVWRRTLGRHQVPPPPKPGRMTLTAT